MGDYKATMTAYYGTKEQLSSAYGFINGEPVEILLSDSIYRDTDSVNVGGKNGEKKEALSAR